MTDARLLELIEMLEASGILLKQDADELARFLRGLLEA